MQYTSEQEKQFDNVLKHHAKYRSVKGEEGVWEILCKNGDIEPYSMTELCASVVHDSKAKMTYLAKSLPSYCKFTQRGDDNGVFKFPTEMLDEIAVIVKARKKRVLKEETKRKLADRLNALRKAA